jgi:prepilin-type N-terminal cleavage/methylation domain-containing protein
MRPTSTTTPGPDPARAQAGFTLLEMLVALTLMALAVLIVLPSGAAMLDRVTAHAVFFDFQRQLSDLRLKAYRSEAPVTIRDAVAPNPDAAAQLIPLRAGWSYTLDHPIAISEGGACGPALATVLKNGHTVMHLRMADTACHLSRLD